MKMKYIIVTILLSLVVNVTAAQAHRAAELSNTEAFLAKAGTLLQKETLTVGKIKKVEVQVLHLTDLISSESISAIRLIYDTGSSYSRFSIAVLDADEISNLGSSFSIIEEKVSNTVPDHNTEIVFSSRGGFQAGCVWSKQKWRTYI